MITVKTDSNQPLYIALADAIEEDILSNDYTIGDRYYSETELCSQTGLSRSTVRSAIQLLTNTGLLSKRRGSGTYVRRIGSKGDARRFEQQGNTTKQNIAHVFTSSTQRARDLGATPASLVLDWQIITPNADYAKFFSPLNLEDSHLIEVTRLRTVDGIPTTLERIYLPLCYSSLTRQDLSDSLYAALSQKFGVTPQAGQRSIGIAHADNREAFFLEVEPDTALLLVIDKVLDDAGAPLHISVQLSRSDRQTYIFELPFAPEAAPKIEKNQS